MRALHAILTPLFVTVAIEATFTLTARAAIGSAFTYQGVISNDGQPASGVFDLRFGLYTNASGGALAAGPVTNENVRVTNGLFTTPVDFGPGIYNGADYWLDVAVRGGTDTGQFTPLAPRQLLTPAPYAFHARQAAGVAPGSIDGAALQNGAVVRSINGLQDDFKILGDGLQVDTVGDSIIVRLPPPDCFTHSNCYWNLRGNGNIVAGVHFLGTVAGELAPLEFRVNNNRSLLHEFTGANTSPNVIGGFRNNAVSGTGVTISGGGQLSGINQALSSWATVAGGYSNAVQASSDGGTISGGSTNRVAGTYGTVGGGALNVASNYSVVGGGSRNRALSSHASIGGGEINTIQPLIAGMVTLDSPHCTIGGGVSNAMNGAEAGVIGGGRSNRLVGSSSRLVHHATINGGQANAIFSDTFSSHNSTIGGGFSNEIHTAGSATIGGGRENMMFLEGNGGTIGGGQSNILNGPYSTISGGRANLIGPSPQSPDYCTIGGGNENSILFEGHYSTVGGGRRNRVEGFARYSGILGGFTNVITGEFGAIGGGTNNLVNGIFGTIPGGLRNIATNMTLAAGRRAQAIHTGAFVWSDSNDFNFPSTNINSFNVRATGGTRIVSGINGAGVPNAGVTLDPGDTAWSVISDRNVKKNFRPVDTEAVLERLANVPVQQWNYVWEDDARPPRLGPMAQDFKQAFYPGADDKVITTLEFDGVALAAIQGLNQKLKAKEAEIRDLRQRQDKLEQLLYTLLQKQ